MYKYICNKFQYFKAKKSLFTNIIYYLFCLLTYLKCLVQCLGIEGNHYIIVVLVVAILVSFWPLLCSETLSKAHHFPQSLRTCMNTQLCLTLCNLKDCRSPGSSIHGIVQARMLEWITISFSRGSSPPRDQTCVSCRDRHILYHWVTRGALMTFRFSSLLCKSTAIKSPPMLVNFFYTGVIIEI